MTKKENFLAIANLDAVKANAELSNFIAHEIELLDKKSSYKSSKPTKRQTENEVIKGRIAEILTDEGQTVTEILAQLGDASLTNQRVSALLTQMKNSGTVNKEIVKGKSLFTLA
jgi:hypothetical protein